MTNEEHRKIVDAIIDAHKDNEMGGKYAKAFNHGVQSAFNRVCKALDDINYSGVYSFELNLRKFGNALEDATRFLGSYLRRFVDGTL